MKTLIMYPNQYNASFPPDEEDSDSDEYDSSTEDCSKIANAEPKKTLKPGDDIYEQIAKDPILQKELFFLEDFHNHYEVADTKEAIQQAFKLKKITDKNTLVNRKYNANGRSIKAWMRRHGPRYPFPLSGPIVEEYIKRKLEAERIEKRFANNESTICIVELPNVSQNANKKVRFTKSVVYKYDCIDYND